MATADQAVERAVLVTDGVLDPNQATTRLALFDESGASINPANIGGVTDLADLEDVDATTPTEDDVLTWDGDSWVPQAPAAEAQTGDDIVLTGYVAADGSDDIVATDTLNEALNKLAVRMTAVEGA